MTTKKKINVKKKCTFKNKHNGGHRDINRSKKMLKQTINTVYNNDLNNKHEIKKKLISLCDYEYDKNEIFSTKSRENIIQLAVKLGLNENKLNELSNDELCMYIEDDVGFTIKDYLRSIFNPMAQLGNYGTSGFINAINESTSELLLNNKIVYASSLGDLSKISTKQKAQWVLEGENTLVTLKTLLNEINIVKLHGKSTSLKDTFRKHGKRSRFFIGKLTYKQAGQLNELQTTLKYNIEMTSQLLFDLQEDEKVRKEINNIIKSKLKKEELDILRDDLKYNKENIRLKQVDKYGSVVGNVVNASEDITSQTINSITKTALDMTMQKEKKNVNLSNSNPIFDMLSFISRKSILGI